MMNIDKYLEQNYSILPPISDRQISEIYVPNEVTYLYAYQLRSDGVVCYRHEINQVSLHRKSMTVSVKAKTLTANWHEAYTIFHKHSGWTYISLERDLEEATKQLCKYYREMIEKEKKQLQSLERSVKLHSQLLEKAEITQ